MKNLKNLIENAAKAAFGSRYQEPEPETFDGIGKIVDIIEQGRELGIDAEELRAREIRLYEDGLSRYGVTFAKNVETGEATSCAGVAIPVEFIFSLATKGENMEQYVGKPSFVNFTLRKNTYVAKALGPFTG